LVLNYDKVRGGIIPYIVGNLLLYPTAFFSMEAALGGGLVVGGLTLGVATLSVLAVTGGIAAIGLLFYGAFELIESKEEVKRKQKEI